MSTQPTRFGPEIDPEREKIILDRLATVDEQPNSDAREAIEGIRKN